MNTAQTDAGLSSATTSLEIATAVAVKQKQVMTREGDAAIALLEAAGKIQRQQSDEAAARGGIDVQA